MARGKATLQAKKTRALLSHMIATLKGLKLIETRLCTEQVTINKMFKALGVQQVH